MKKIYTLFFALACTGAMFAQGTKSPSGNFAVEAPKALKDQVVSFKKQIPNEKTQATNSFWIDYDYGDFVASGGMNTGYPGPGYRYHIWPTNVHYNGASSSSDYTSFTTSTMFGAFYYNYFSVGFDSIYDAANGIGYDKNQITSITLDSIAFTMGQENNSGFDDSIKITVMKVKKIQALNNYPDEANVIATFGPTVIATGGQGVSPSNQYSDIVPLAFVANTPLGNGVKGFAIKIEYMGNKQDTAVMLVGFNDEGGDGSVCYDKPLLTAFRSNTVYPNGSTYAWNAPTCAANSLTYPLPIPAGNDMYIECDGSSGATAGDGKSITQNAAISAKVTIVTTGMLELKRTGVSLNQNMPNPFNGNTNISYELADNKNVKLEVFDIAGKRLMNIEEGFKSAGRHNIVISASDLNAGVYFYTLTAGDVRVTKRMTIVE